MKLVAPELADVRHIKLCYSKERYCGHPLQCGIYNFGNGELAVSHNHAPCRYKESDDVIHSATRGYQSRAKILLQRSTDDGETWPRDNDVVVWDESLPLEEKRSILYRADEPGVAREQIDLNSPEAAVYFTLAATGPEDADGERIRESFAFRSADRGRTWETVPTRVPPPPGCSAVYVGGYRLVKCPDGTLLVSSASMLAQGGYPERLVATVYGSDDSGLSWEYLAEVARDPMGVASIAYNNMILLPSGRLQYYMLSIGGLRHAIQMAYSDDGGYSWSEPKPIVAWGQSPWVAHSGRYAWLGARRQGVHYRSPWPLRLNDGRIVVLFARRKRPFGIGLIVSEDDGASWSSETVIRADASDWDLGYHVSTQLDDGRIFTAYYYMEDDGNGFGGTRYIAGSFFRLP